MSTHTNQRPSSDHVTARLADYLSHQLAGHFVDTQPNIVRTRAEQPRNDDQGSSISLRCTDGRQYTIRITVARELSAEEAARELTHPANPYRRWSLSQ